MKKNNKGFTLIELLVVVAIIGILAAVGVTAYSGYTTSAKKASAKSNHATVKKYVANELKKCELDGGIQMSTNLTCADISGTANTVADAVEDALVSFKNPYAATSPAIKKQTAETCSDAGAAGRTSISDDSTTVTISTCFDKTSAALSDTVTIE
jgi:type IV pilus assembly protein PilA